MRSVFSGGLFFGPRMAHRVVVQASDQGTRLDGFLRHQGLENYRIRQKLIRTGRVRVNRGRVSAGFRLTAGDAVTWPQFYENTASSPTKRPNAAPGNIPGNMPGLEAYVRAMVLYEGSDFFVLDKPAGLAVQGGTGQKVSLDHWLPVLGGSETPRLVHRLDRPTSGLLLIAKTRVAARRLTAYFAQQLVTKLYFALTEAHPGAAAPASPPQTPEAPPHEPQTTGCLTEPLSRCGKQMRPDPHGAPASTWWWHVACVGTYHLIALAPLTGRTHQIRSHLAATGCPVLGDTLYSGRPATRLFLHAAAMQLPMPSPMPSPGETKENEKKSDPTPELCFFSPLPASFLSHVHDWTVRSMLEDQKKIQAWLRSARKKRQEET